MGDPSHPACLPHENNGLRSSPISKIFCRLGGFSKGFPKVSSISHLRFTVFDICKIDFHILRLIFIPTRRERRRISARRICLHSFHIFTCSMHAKLNQNQKSIFSKSIIVYLNLHITLASRNEDSNNKWSQCLREFSALPELAKKVRL